jgi:uncharacterized protein (DUF2249 family)
MQQNVIHIPSFQGEYKTGLIFSMIEGLIPGKSLKLTCEQAPQELELLLQESGIKNLTWSSQKDNAGRWELIILKKDPINETSVGCCGMCGGHAQEKLGG